MRALKHFFIFQEPEPGLFDHANSSAEAMQGPHAPCLYLRGRLLQDRRGQQEKSPFPVAIFTARFLPELTWRLVPLPGILNENSQSWNPSHI